MPSGNAIYTYTGPEESTDVQGQIFLKDQPKHITDQGVIAVCAAREDFAESIVQLKEVTKPLYVFGEVGAEDGVTMPAGEDLEEGDAVYLSDGKAYKAPAKPKKAKSK